MSPERMAAHVSGWVRRYTRGLPGPVARRRIGEIESDLHDHIAHERSCGTREGRIAIGILSRAVRGLPADRAWRAARARAASPTTSKEKALSRRAAHRSVVRVASATALILLTLLVAMQFTGGMAWDWFDFALAGVLLAAIGSTLELAAARGRGIRGRAAAAFPLGVAAIGVAAMVLGEVDDAPGLVLAGILLVVAALTFTVRTAQRSR